jgi:membrane-bound lytic murein transglycosylase D
MARWLLTLTWATFLIQPLLAADSPAKADERFTAYHAILEDAAKAILAREREPETVAQAGEAQPPFTLRPSATDQLHWFAERFWNGRSEELDRAVQRVEAVRPALETILEAHGIPKALAAVVLVESAGRPDALSPKGARGLWQFVATTARRYGLRVDGTGDERLEMQPSTHAAARYLRDLHDRFGNWPLALAAYNAGEGAVGKAIGRAGSTDFAILSSLRLLPAETRNYVPAVLAAMDLFEAPGLAELGQEITRNNRVVYAGPIGNIGGAP